MAGFVAFATSATAETNEELKARIAILEKENAKLHQELRHRRDSSGVASSAVKPEAAGRTVATAKPLAAPAGARAVQAYAAVPPLSGTWTGFYVGGNFGVSVGKKRPTRLIVASSESPRPMASKHSILVLKGA